MKKIISTTVLVIVFAGFQSCKKNQAADPLIENTTETTAMGQPAANTPAASQENPSAELLKTAQSKPLTNLVLSEDSFNFGDIKKGTEKDHTYQVTNTGKNPLIISAVKPGCGCTVPDYSKEPILPGKKGYITLKFDSSNFDGAIHKQAEIFANVEKAPIIISFSGNVIP